MFLAVLAALSIRHLVFCVLYTEAEIDRFLEDSDKCVFDLQHNTYIILGLVGVPTPRLVRGSGSQDFYMENEHAVEEPARQ